MRQYTSTQTTVPYGAQSIGGRRKSSITALPYHLYDDVLQKPQARRQSDGSIMFDPDTFQEAIKLVQKDVFEKKKPVMNIIVLDAEVDHKGSLHFMRKDIPNASVCDGVGYVLYKHSSIVKKMYDSQKKIPATFQKASDVMICFTTFLIDSHDDTNQTLSEKHLTSSKLRKKKWKFVSKLSSDDFLFSCLPERFDGKSLVIIIMTFHMAMTLYQEKQKNDIIHRFVNT